MRTATQRLLSILFRTGTGRKLDFTSLRKRLSCAAARVVAGIGDAGSRLGGLIRPALFAQTIEPRGETSEDHKMKTRCFDHIDLRVKNMEVARTFYAKFLPQLGFVHEKPGDDFHTFYSAGGDKPSEFFGFTQDRHHRPNGTRIAFWADTRDEVDRIAELVREAGGKTLEGPEICADYSPGYYAFFFEDPDGNKLEICCRESPIVAKRTNFGEEFGNE
jgi:catechol 2,3-dioxygenase-like lactoylglutathione lyase family enzyme